MLLLLIDGAKDPHRSMDQYEHTSSINLKDVCMVKKRE